jgi:hypothetical protein
MSIIDSYNEDSKQELYADSEMYDCGQDTDMQE